MLSSSSSAISVLYWWRRPDWNLLRSFTDLKELLCSKIIWMEDKIHSPYSVKKYLLYLSKANMPLQQCLLDKASECLFQWVKFFLVHNSLFVLLSLLFCSYQVQMKFRTVECSFLQENFVLHHLSRNLLMAWKSRRNDYSKHMGA